MWKRHIENPPQIERSDTWPLLEHPAGFDPHGASCATPIRQTLNALADNYNDGALQWLCKHRKEMEKIAECPLAMTGVAAAAMIDLDINAEQGEMLFLLLRLPGAAVHALEQRNYGWRKYPFFTNSLVLEDDPGPPASPS